MLTHLVFGAGLIGCYLGASLQHKKQNVTLLSRDQIKQKLSAGITLTDYQNHRTLVNDIAFLDLSAGSVRQFDIIWLTVKCTGVESAINDLKQVVGNNTTIICCQNGLGSEAPIKQAFPTNRVLRSMVPFNVVEMSDGHYHRGSQGILSIESFTDNTDNFTEALVSHIDSTILPCSPCYDMTSLLWAKLQLNLGNSVNALADIPVKKMLQQRKYRLVIAQMMRELLLVTDAQGIELPKVTSIPAHTLPFILSLPTFLFKVVANRMLAIDDKVRTSMWWDINNGKQTEIDHLNGVIVKHAEALGIATPVNQKVIELIHKLTNNSQSELKGILAEQLYKEVIDG